MRATFNYRTYNLNNTYSFLPLGDSRPHCETWPERPTEAGAEATLGYVRRGKCSGNVVGFTSPTREWKEESVVERREGAGRRGWRTGEGNQRKSQTEKEGSAGTKRGRAREGELETRFASCRHLEAISYRFTRAPAKVSVHLHSESSFEIARCTYCNACYEYRPGVTEDRGGTWGRVYD